MSVSAKFSDFLTNIQLTENQIADARSKHTNVRSALEKGFYSPPYPATTSILVGSYGRNTAVRPPTDVDILFIMPSSKWINYRMYPGNGPSKLLQDVKSVLQKTYPTTTMRGDGQVVVVSFANSFGVEVLPVFASTEAGLYYTPNTHNGGSWKTTNPDAEKKHISDSNKNSNGNTVHLVKMMKVWKHVCSVPLSSLAIELMAVPFIGQWNHRGKSTVYYDWMVRDFLAYALTRVNSCEFIPGISELYWFGNAWKTRAETAFARAQKACDYEAQAASSTGGTQIANDTLATLEWERIFGGFFTGKL